MAPTSLQLSFAFVVLVIAYADASRFFWKPYDGEIPPEAIPLGFDTTKSQAVLYAGRGYVCDHGYCGTVFGEIRPGQKSMRVVIRDPVVTTNTSILCSTSDKSVKWINTDHRTFFNDISHDSVVAVGTVVNQTDPSDICQNFIGRNVMSPTQTLIGNIGNGSTIYAEQISPLFSYVGSTLIWFNPYFEVLVEN